MDKNTMEREAAYVTTEELLRIAGNRKIEMLNAAAVVFLPAGHMRAYAAGETFVSLRAYARRMGIGLAVTDSAAFRAELPHRWSFCPDASYYVGPIPWMECYPEPPVFAVEIRSESDYGLAAERDIANKRADYFAAGTQVVWDVDLLNPDVIRKYAADRPKVAVPFGRGETADAEPALPGWTMPVEDLFL
jgi:Uma2 family endonuclease